MIDVPKKTLDWIEVQIPVTAELSGVKCLRFELVKGTVDLDVVNFSKFNAVNPPEGKSSEYCIPGAVYPCVDDEGRATFALNAPDAKEVAADIDGKVYFSAKKRIAPGSFANVKITEVLDYDLCGEAVM